MPKPFLLIISFLYNLELILADAAQRAYPIVRERLKWNTWFNALLGITYLGVVDPLTYCTDILFHNGFDLLNIQQTW